MNTDSSRQLFTTWFTSTADMRDHAVTDEAFAASRGTADAVCGALVVFGPMEWPQQQQRCGECSSIVDCSQPVRPPAHGVTMGALFGWLWPDRRAAPAQTGNHSPLERAPRYPQPPAEEMGAALGSSAGFQAGAGQMSPAPVPNFVAPQTPAVTNNPPMGGRAGLETPPRLQATHPQAGR